MCGTQNSVGLAVPFAVDKDGKIRFEYTPSTEYTGYPGIIHGGVISAILDEGMSWPHTISTGEMLMTVDLRIRFRKPVPSDKPFLFIAETIENGKKSRIIEAKGQILSPNGKVLAEAQAKYMSRSPEASKQIWNQMDFTASDFTKNHFLSLLETKRFR